MARVVLIGEGMLELSRPRPDGEWVLGHGGDTLNTAVHLARAGHAVRYLTAVGADPLSRGLVARWADEGLDTALVLTHPERTAGLYVIATDAQGERSFTYWRSDSAARTMMDLPGTEAALAALVGADLVAFSLITLAILPPAGRERLLAALRRVRREGGLVAFDGNYRPRLWPSPAAAREARDAAIACASIGLPTLEDERLLGARGDGAAVAAHWAGLGCAEPVVKLGSEGCLLPDGRTILPPQRLQPVDTSGAGDAFNAGYLDSRLRGGDRRAAALAGHRLAGWTIMRPGAIPPAENRRPDRKPMD